MKPRYDLSIAGSIRKIIDHAAQLTGVPAGAITGRSRDREIALVRFAVVRAARTKNYSYPQIGRVMKRDHSTIINAARRAEDTVNRDSAFAALCSDLINGSAAKTMFPIGDTPLGMAAKAAGTEGDTA